MIFTLASQLVRERCGLQWDIKKQGLALTLFAIYHQMLLILTDWAFKLFKMIFTLLGSHQKGIFVSKKIFCCKIKQMFFNYISFSSN